MTPSDLRDLLHRPVEEVAPFLLGCVLRGRGAAVRITEVEAYAAADDPASHAWRGRSVRNATMFGPAGRAYVYVSHGIHPCVNVVTGEDGEAAAVLVRAGAVVEGRDVVAERRVGIAERDWTRGPGRLAVALGITAEDDGADLLGAGSLRLEPGDTPGPDDVLAGPRVGVSRAVEVPWRFHLRGEPSVSAYRRPAPRRRAGR